MRIKYIYPKDDFTLYIVAEDGRTGIFDVTPYLQYEAFTPLKKIKEFRKCFSGGYYVGWRCEADLSADTIEHEMKFERGSKS